MKIPVGGYQMVDISEVTLGDQAVIITNAKKADILRKTCKPVFFYGAKSDSTTVACPAFTVTDTGAVDGKVYTIFVGKGLCTVTTDDDKVIFTPPGA